jgi:glucokinase
MPYALGLDFGGTKLAAGLIVDGRVLASARCPTPPAAEESIAAMVRLARSLLAPQPTTRGSRVRLARPTVRVREDTLIGVGVSFGGPVAPDGRTTRLSMHIPGWEQLALADLLEREFDVPAVVANDGDAAALAEYRFGAGQGVQTLLYLTVSTGIGGGLVINGALHRGERAWAGEVGHLLLQAHGPRCPCGRRGCLESLASGQSIAREARVRLTHLNPAAPETLTAQDVVAAAESDPAARAVWLEAMTWLGYGIASAANLINPGRVVLGGGLTNAGAALFAPVRSAAAERALDPELTIVPAALGGHVGIIGGGALVLPADTAARSSG